MIVSFRWNYYFKTGNRRRDALAGTLAWYGFHERRGRKDYWCVDCGQVIPAGIPHLVDANSVVRIHKHCGIKAVPEQNPVPRNLMEAM